MASVVPQERHDAPARPTPGRVPARTCRVRRVPVRVARVRGGAGPPGGRNYAASTRVCQASMGAWVGTRGPTGQGAAARGPPGQVVAPPRVGRGGHSDPAARTESRYLARLTAVSQPGGRPLTIRSQTGPGRTAGPRGLPRGPAVRVSGV